jgi:hypothetical protein
VAREGFEPTARSVELSAGQRTTLALQLTPTAQTRAAYHDSIATQRTWGWISLVGGAVIAAGGGTLAAVEQNRLNTAHDQYDELLPLFKRESDLECDPALGDSLVNKKNHCSERLQAAKDKVDSSASLRTIGVITAGVGAAALITGVVLLLTSGDPDKYEASANASPTLQLTGGPNGLALLGKF